MPLHTYKCDTCFGELEQYFAKASQVVESIELESCGRSDCPCIAHKLFSCQFSYKIAGWSPDKERKQEDHMKYVDQVMSEGVDPSEVKEGNDMLREREKMKGLPEGALSGKRPTEAKEVSAGGATIDRLALAKKIDSTYAEKHGVHAPIERIVEMTNDKVKETVGSTAVAQKVVRQGKEQLKRRAKQQAQLRG